MKKLTAAELGPERFDTMLVCLAMANETIALEHNDSTDAPRPGLDVMRELAAKDPRWARIALDVMEGKREMPRELEPAPDDHIATTAWYIRGALLVAAAGHVPELCTEDRRMLTEILTVTEQDYDDALERVSAGALTPVTKHALLVEPLRRILDAS